MGTRNCVNTQNPIVQIAYTSTSSVVTCNSDIPSDDTIPQNTEGIQVMTLAITPTSATSLLRLKCVCTGTNNAGSAGYTIALFQDTTANALAAIRAKIEAGKSGVSALLYTMVAGTTSSTTFKIRVGSHNIGGIAYINGDIAGGRFLGGVAGTFFYIEEFLK